MTGIGTTSDLQQCIDVCTECHRMCTQTAAYCLGQGGRHAESEHLRLLLDCADICATSARFMMRGSELHELTCSACAEICARCAESCERMSDDETMRACAEVCRRCAESCRRMSKAA
jgi:hypothetical protein